MRYQDRLDTDALRRYAASINQRAKAKKRAGTVGAADLQTHILESGGRCAWCGGDVIQADFEIDHIISLSQQGRNDAANLAVTCVSCNRAKGEKHPATFAAERIAAGGRRTALIERVLTYYDIQAAVQQSFFPPGAEDNPMSGDDEDRPPYRWV